ncbi:disease resistance protein RUN1-like [Eucalyptus grandis]|uniref:disease resistance protein RUN1-like n=1 Tax=Eucalyptus grandis TaxID=71139 RepID=UPI00192EEF47|nr:disease resistance protein RUN1-like [Eucalyptus grandis]
MAREMGSTKAKVAVVFPFLGVTVLAVVDFPVGSTKAKLFTVFLFLRMFTARVVVSDQFSTSATVSMVFVFLGMIIVAVVVFEMRRRNRESFSTSSSLSITNHENHEVFLNFRGADTRKGFMDHLHGKLVDAGIEVFKDDENLHAGEDIMPALKEAIRQSRISIAILSKDYASSKSCLMEVVQMHESQLVKGVLRRVRQVLKKDDQVVTDKLVGIDLHVREMMRKLGVVYNNGQAIEVCGQDVRVLGICGMPGVGKTTLAKIVFNKMHMLFDECSFLPGINSKGIMLSQEMLISDLQKEKPAPLRSSDEGIKKIASLFSRMKVLIVLDGVHEVEQAKALAEKLSWFGPGSRIIVTTSMRNVLDGFDDGPAKEYKVEPMKYHHALQLFRKHAFRGDALQDANEVEAAFRVHYDSLDVPTRKIFLDIACFFIEKDERILSYMWEACDYYPARGIKYLREMHFLEIGENNELRMHDLLRDFGRKLVERKDLHERCRIWNHGDAVSVLKDSEKLVILDLSWSPVTEDSQVWRQIMQKVDELKVLNLQGCVQLPALLNFRAPINLEILILEDCTQLSQIGPFISNLKNLSSLNLRKCSRVRQLPLELCCMKSLRELLIDGTGIYSICFPEGSLENLEILSACDCQYLQDISTIGRLRSLSSLALDGADIDGLPYNVEFLQNFGDFL